MNYLFIPYKYEKDFIKAKVQSLLYKSI